MRIAESLRCKTCSPRFLKALVSKTPARIMECLNRGCPEGFSFQKHHQQAFHGARHDVSGDKSFFRSCELINVFLCYNRDLKKIAIMPQVLNKQIADIGHGLMGM